MRKYGKKYKAAYELIDHKKLYSVKEAVSLLKKTSVTKFDSTVDVSFNLNINTKMADQQVRGTIVLPSGTGKEVKVLALSHSNTDAALKAGATYAGGKELLDKIVNEKWFDFDVICATPDMMGEIGKAGRVLGPKGLMPNPKTGTVGQDLVKMVTELRAGKVEYRADKAGNVNLGIGKVSFEESKIEDNLNAIINQILKVRPQSVKGQYLRSCTVSTTMGPAIKVLVENAN